MPTIDIPRHIAEISAMHGVPVRLVARHIGEPTPGVPELWQPVLDATDRQSRVSAALDLWPADLRELLTEFWGLLHKNLYEVAVVMRGTDPALLYITYDTDEDPPLSHFWFGYAPYTSQEQPLGWELQPPPMQEFLNTVHGGIVMEDGDAWGILPPDQWRHWAADGGWPDGVPGWNPVHVDSETLIIIGSSPVLMWMCVSPQLETETATRVFDGQTNPKPYWEVVDGFLSVGFSIEPWRS